MQPRCTGRASARDHNSLRPHGRFDGMPGAQVENHAAADVFVLTNRSLVFNIGTVKKLQYTMFFFARLKGMAIFA